MVSPAGRLPFFFCSARSLVVNMMLSSSASSHEVTLPSDSPFDSAPLWQLMIRARNGVAQVVRGAHHRQTQSRCPALQVPSTNRGHKVGMVSQYTLTAGGSLGV